MTSQEHEQHQILIVEDEPKIARLVADYLEGSGFATHHLDHGDAVLPWLSEARQAGQGPVLVLLDLMLPGTDGLTLCREIRQRWPALPVAWSGLSMTWLRRSTALTRATTSRGLKGLQM